MALSDLKITGIFESLDLRALCLLWDIVPAKFLLSQARLLLLDLHRKVTISWALMV